MHEDRRDVRIQVTAKNNLLLSKMEEWGIESVAELCRRIDRPSSQDHVGGLVNMKIPALREDGKWRAMAIRLADFFMCSPEDLFSTPQQEGSLKHNRVAVEASFAEIQYLIASQRQQALAPDSIVEAKELKRKLRRLLPDRLNNREMYVIAASYGFGCEATEQQIALEMGISRSRVQKIRARALEKLRQPERFADPRRHPLARAGALDGGTLSALSRLKDD